MRMAPCPMCGGKNTNGFKKNNKWYSTCYNKECRYTTEVGMPTRKMSRYNWNLNYEHITGEKLPDEMCGRQRGSFMKKEIRCGVPQLVHCFSKEDFDNWSKQYKYSDIDWLVPKGKKARAKYKKERNKAKKAEQ